MLTTRQSAGGLKESKNNTSSINELVVHRENASGQGARLNNSWLLGLRAAQVWSILTRTSEEFQT